MCEEFDPSWEYYVPDPEVQYIFDRSSIDSRLTLLDRFSDDRLAKYWGKGGFQFGSGDPNKRSTGKMAWLREGEIEYQPTPNLRVCPTCGDWFRPERVNKGHRGKYCTRKCYIPLGAKKVLVDKECRQCGITFSPRVGVQQFCTMSCASKYKVVHQGMPTGVPAVSKVDLVHLKELDTRGLKVREIADVLGISYNYCKKLRKTIGAKRGPRGRIYV